MTIFMLKEIYEQPKAIQDTYRGRLRPEDGLIKMAGIDAHLDRFLKANRIVIVGLWYFLACGTCSGIHFRGIGSNSCGGRIRL